LAENTSAQGCKLGIFLTIWFGRKYLFLFLEIWPNLHLVPHSGI